MKSLGGRPRTRNPHKDLHISTYEEFLAKKGRFRDCEQFYLREEFSKEFIASLIDDMEAFYNNKPEAIKITIFLEERKIRPRIWRKWKAKYSDIHNADEYFKMIIGNRREIRGLEGKLNWSGIEKSMPIYDEEWKELLEWREKLRNKEEDAKSGIVAIRIPSFKDPED